MVRRFQSHYRLKEDLSLVDNIITQPNCTTNLPQAVELAAQFHYNYRNDTNGGIQGLKHAAVSTWVRKSQGQTELEFRIMVKTAFHLTEITVPRK